MQLSLLCPVEAVGEDGTPLPLGGPRQRALLAYLLLHANRVVAADRLVEELWESPPRDAHAALQNQVSRLRKVLGDRLVTRAPGYLLRIEPGELDLDRFRAAVADAGSISDLSERSRVLREADALFRGTPLADVDAPFAAGEAAALEELRLAAVEARVDADLERGRHAELVPELGALVGHHPLRERLRGQHILALYRCGRQAEALEAYRDTRRTLDEQLGLEPSPALRELERAILTQDPELAVAVAPPPVEPALAPSAPPFAPESLRRRRTGLVLAFALVVLALAIAAAATAVVLTRSSGPERASTGTSAVAAVTPVVTHHRVAHKTAPHVVTAKAYAHPSAPMNRTRAHRVVRQQPVAAPQTPPATTTAAAQTTPAARPKQRPKPVQQPPAVTTTPAPSGVATFTDDFSETTPNTNLWNVTGNGSGYTWALQNGRLEVTIPPDAQPGGNYGMVGLGWASQCRFDGNYDERIDFQLLEWPPGVGAHVQLSGWVFPEPNASSGRMINQYSDSYNGNIGQSWDLVDTHDQQGTLRLARVDGVTTAYYLAGGKWVVLHAGNASGKVQLGIEVFATANEWTHKQIRVAFDNFSVTASDVVCA
jgi:DNA-binding SARP family transcriptional activator